MVDLSRPDPLDDALELLHFAFRKTVEAPDRLLAKHGLGRVHHRILFFVRRRAGLSVGELLTVLGVTKQALARPLRELHHGGWLKAEPTPGDRRTKQLELTARGRTLERRLSGDQRRRFQRAFRAAGPSAEAGWRAVMHRVAR